MSNTTTITGNLTREPEIRYTKEGQATAQLGVAVNRRWQDRATPGMAGGDRVTVLGRGCLARLGRLRASGSRLPLDLSSWVKWESAPTGGLRPSPASTNTSFRASTVPVRVTSTPRSS